MEIIKCKLADYGSAKVIEKRAEKSSHPKTDSHAAK